MSYFHKSFMRCVLSQFFYAFQQFLLICQLLSNVKRPIHMVSFVVNLVGPTCSDNRVSLTHLTKVGAIFGSHDPGVTSSKPSSKLW